MKKNKNIPKTLHECFIELDKMATAAEKDQLMSCRENETPFGWHMGIGMWIRNNWGLWAGGELQDHFKELGLFHADDMSGMIFHQYRHYLRKAARDS